MSDSIQSFAMPESAFMVRQPIFSRDKTVWGYELATSCVPVLADASQASCFADFVATFQSTLSFLVGGLAASQKIIVNVDKDNLCFDMGVSTEWGNCIFNLSADAIAAEESGAFVEFIHGNGGMVALEGGSYLLGHGDLLDMSDFIRISMAGKKPQEVVALRRTFKDFGGRLLVQAVRSWQDYEGTRALGFNFFQGPFFTLPEIREDRELSVGGVAQMQLLRELGNPDCEMDDLANIIASDVSLSYRILKYINSASFGFRNEISSIQQAVSLLGLREVRHWAMMVIMTGLDSSNKGAELGFLALQRARFLSQLSEVTPGFPHSSSSMFLLGLFSQLDALLSLSMEEVLEDMPLEREMRDALCDRSGKYGDWLQLMESVEVGNWAEARTLLMDNDVDFGKAATQYMKASSWAAALMPDAEN